MKSKPKTFSGDRCARCGRTERYVSNRNCCFCRKRSTNSIKAMETTPDKPRHDRHWPRVMTADGTTIPADPMLVLMQRAAQRRVSGR